jgi:hypothetical protein
MTQEYSAEEKAKLIGIITGMFSTYSQVPFLMIDGGKNVRSVIVTCDDTNYYIESEAQLPYAIIPRKTANSFRNITKVEDPRVTEIGGMKCEWRVAGVVCGKEDTVALYPMADQAFGSLLLS